MISTWYQNQLIQRPQKILSTNDNMITVTTKNTWRVKKYSHKYSDLRLEFMESQRLWKKLDSNTVIKVTFFWNCLIGHYFWRWMGNAINIHPIWSKLAWLRAIPTWPNIDPGLTIPNLTQKLLTFRYLSRNLDEPKFWSIRRPTWPDLTKLWTLKDQLNMLAMETRTLESIIVFIFLWQANYFY